jgi:type II secretory pathway component HofQ
MAVGTAPTTLGQPMSQHKKEASRTVDTARTQNDNQASSSTANPPQHVVKKRRRNNVHESFPEKLYRMIEEAEEAGKRDSVSFTTNGRAFRVNDQKQFCSEILPNYFRHKRYDSFKVRMWL